MPLSKAGFGRLALLLLACGFVVLIGVGASLLWLVGESRRYAEGVAGAQEVRVATTQVLGLLQDAETGQRGYLLTNDARYLEPYRRAAAELPGRLDALKRLIAADGGSSAGAAQLTAAAESKLRELADTVELAERGDLARALAVVRGDAGRRVMDEARTVVAGIEARTTDRLERRQAGFEGAGRTAVAATAAALALILAIAAGCVWLALRYTRALEGAEREVRAANEALEGRVADRTAELTAANDEIQRFAYIVSHDLRAPLVNVMGFTAELETALAPLRTQLAAVEERVPALATAEAKEALLADIPESLGFIRSSTERMDRLIAAILRLSREGQRRLAPEPVDMAALFEGLGGSLSHQVAEAGAELRIEAAMPAIEADRVALEQVFGNLLDNAVKYLEPGRAGRIVVRGRPAGPRAAVYEIEDNGRGIDARDHERVFDLFRRAGRQDRPGEGIGLAHVRALVRRLGGTIRFTSALGRGTVFSVTLPRTPPAPDAARESRA